MNDEISASESPIVKSIVFSVLKKIIREKGFVNRGEVINADLVPRVSVKNFGSRETMESSVASPTKSKMILPSQRPHFNPPVKTMPPRRPPHFQRAPQMNVPQGQNSQANFQGGYGVLDGLLRDNSVSTIECSGAGKSLSVVRAGQKQMTKIVLNEKQIKDFLEKVSEKARIPLMEGVFKAAVDNFVVNAVVSEMIGSRFVIRKQTPYSLLENG